MINCAALSDIANGMIMYSDGKLSPHKFGMAATYECKVGYELIEGDAVRTCVGNGSNSTGYWNGTAPNCSGKSHRNYGL